MSERSGIGWSGELYGQAPVQGVGRVDGLSWYFRARAEAWSFEVADDAGLDPDHLPIAGWDTAGWLVEEDLPGASYIKPEVAWSLIEDCIN